MAGWLVGNFDFNENPVVHLDFDFDLGFVNIRDILLKYATYEFTNIDLNSVFVKVLI